MGVSASTHFGPYIAVKPLMKEHPINLWGCVNGKCRKFEKEFKDKFCSECGKPTGHFEKTERRKFDFYQFFREDKTIEEDRFYRLHYIVIEGYEIFVESFRPKDAPKDFRVSVDGTKILDIDSEKIVKEKKWFEAYYSELITKAIEVFGAENIKVEYGVITYLS